MIIPTVIDSDGRTDRAYDIYSRLLEDRIIYLGEDVSPHSANLIIAQLLFLESKDPNKDITLYINSPGGHVYDAFAIYDTIKFIKSDVSTVGIGMQASAAAFDASKENARIRNNTCFMLDSCGSVPQTFALSLPARSTAMRSGKLPTSHTCS